jgi:hypothetical protein
MGPNPLNLPLTGNIGQDIILDKFGNQVAYRCGAIWPGPGIWGRVNDPSHPEGFLKAKDNETGVAYWVRPFTGTVTNGKWVSWNPEQTRTNVSNQETQPEQGGQGQLEEREAQERLVQQVQLDMMDNLFGNLKKRTLPRLDPSKFDPTS